MAILTKPCTALRFPTGKHEKPCSGRVHLLDYPCFPPRLFTIRFAIATRFLPSLPPRFAGEEVLNCKHALNPTTSPFTYTFPAIVYVNFLPGQTGLHAFTFYGGMTIKSRMNKNLQRTRQLIPYRWPYGLMALWPFLCPEYIFSDKQRLPNLLSNPHLRKVASQ